MNSRNGISALASMFAMAMANKLRLKEKSTDKRRYFSGSLFNWIQGKGKARHHLNGRYDKGQTFSMTDGREYRVHNDGSFRRVRGGVA